MSVFKPMRPEPSPDYLSIIYPTLLPPLLSIRPQVINGVSA